MAEEQNKTPLYQRYNYDDVFNRSVIAGLLYLLNHRLTYKQTLDDNTVEEVTVPFAYNFAHARDQRFAQDNYTFFGRECFSDKLIDGKFDMCPRFAMTYSGSQIEASNITNRFVKGTYLKDENGVLTSYTAFMYSIPLTLNFDFEGWIDTLETAFKIEQAIRETFYKNQSFNVLYRGMKIGCRAGFPETYSTGDKTVSYSFESESQLIKMSFSLSVETYQPCFDESQSIQSDKKIEHFAFDPDVFNGNVTPETKKVELHLHPIDTSKFYAAGQTIELSWDAISNSSDVYTILVYYITPDGDKHIIDCSLRQHNFIDWTIPSTISNFKQPNIVFYDDNKIIKKEPKVVVIPESTGYVNSECFGVIDPGEFNQDGYCQVSCEYIDSSANINIYDGYIAEFSKDEGLKQIYYYKDLPEVHFDITNTKRLKYKKGDFGVEITVGIAYPHDTRIKSEIPNMFII
jgi:hypothetical protein